MDARAVLDLGGEVFILDFFADRQGLLVLFARPCQVASCQ